MIIRLYNPLLIPKIINLAKTVPGTPLKTLEKLLFTGINHTSTVIYIDEKDEEVRGFIYASEEMWEGEPVCFIQFCVIKPSKIDNEIGYEFMNQIKLWTKDRGLKNIITVVRRNPEGFCRKYKFEQDGVLLKRSII